METEIIERPIKCYCDEDQGAGYTYYDEHGPCIHCEEVGYDIIDWEENNE